MGEVWGTFAVNDHLRTSAFVREVLLFDRLVIPVPADAEERERWRAPNPNVPAETWDPEHLDQVLEILGTQRKQTSSGASLAWVSDWSKQRWENSADRTGAWSGYRRRAADDITTIDAFYSTRMVLAMDESMPKVVEAVAAYPSETEWRRETSILEQPPDDVDTSSALVALAFPLLIPDPDADPLTALTDAAALARNPDFRDQRDQFYRWLRGYLSPLQDESADLAGLSVDPASLKMAQARLEGQLRAQERILSATGRAGRWDRLQWGLVVAAAAAGTVAALVAAPPLATAVGLAASQAAIVGTGAGTSAAVASLAGWVAGRRSALQEPRPLNGASMFITAGNELATMSLPCVPDQA